MSNFGQLLLYLLTLTAAGAAAFAMVGAKSKRDNLVYTAEQLTYATAGFTVLAFFTLIYAFVIGDYALIYAQQHVERAMPLFYRVTAVWGGMEGSLLLWAALLSVFAALAVRSNRDKVRELLPYMIVVLMVVLLFFAVLLLVHSNPFDTYLVDIPTTGKGLNPLLQNPYMVTHPPSLYLGFVGMTIPFALAIAALISGQTDNSWILAARRWAILAWFFLSLGLTLGMLWAYEELGWGGYWGWDPVENAGFMPWLICTAFIHSIIVQERRHMLRMWNMILAILAFAMTIFGTFLTRSGFIDSVHAFARSNVGWVFLAFIGVILVVGFSLVFWRRKLLRSHGELESVWSREFWFLLNNWVLLSATVLVLVLTTFPNISELFGDKVTISIAAFNRWMVPVGLALLVITGIGPMLGWRETGAESLRRQFVVPAVVATTVVGILLLIGIRHGLGLFAWGLCAFVLTTMIQEIVRAVHMRRKASGQSVLSVLANLIARNRRRYGGYIVHSGIVTMCIGFAGDALKEEKELLMRTGQRVQVGDYVLRYDGLDAKQDAQKHMLTAHLTVYRNGQHIGQISPARWTFFKHEEMPTTEVALHRTVLDDLYVALGDVDPQAGTTFKIVVNPLVNWIWIGFLLLGLGAAVAAIPIPVPGDATSRLTTLLVLGVGLTMAPTIALADTQAEPAPRHQQSGPSYDEHDVSAGPVQLSNDRERSVISKLTCQCGTCPKLALDVCGCGFASQERAAIRAKLAQNWTEDQVLNWYVDKRGPEIGMKPFGAVALAIPPNRGFTRVYWMVPYGAAALGIVALFAAGRKWAAARQSRIATETPPPPTTDDPYTKLLDQELKDS